ncbi:unnamed protein product [Amoebophrya sp. A25]|nr:unnamed protein product [Amoebophrya sp. A25]|eukprot:GSA25T00024653001.1
MAKNVRVKQTRNRKAEGAAASRKKTTVTKNNNPLANQKVAKTARGRRELRKRETKIVENPKTALLIRGQRTREELHQVLKDMHDLKKPLSQAYLRKHEDLNPFEDSSRIVDMCNKQDAGLFAFASSNKKRPSRLVLGRLFNSDLLDMVEFDLSDMCSFLPKARLPTLGAKPLLLFQGSGWELEPDLQHAKSVLMDFFRGANPEKVTLAGLEFVMSFTCVSSTNSGAATSSGGAAASTSSTPNDKTANAKRATGSRILFRAYHVQTKKSTTANLPRVELQETGPRMTMTVDRVKEADPAIMKLAMRVPAGAEKRRVKNEESTATGKKLGRLHLGRQEFGKINTHTSGLSKKVKKAEASSKKAAKSAETTAAAPAGGA